MFFYSEKKNQVFVTNDIFEDTQCPNLYTKVFLRKIFEK